MLRVGTPVVEALAGFGVWAGMRKGDQLFPF